jgi:hypothetical protein
MYTVGQCFACPNIVFGTAEASFCWCSLANCRARDLSIIARQCRVESGRDEAVFGHASRTHIMGASAAPTEMQYRLS